MIRKLILTLIVLSIALLAVPAVSAGDNPPCSTYYTVERGDNLYRIARQFNTTIADLQAWNSIANPSRIEAGQVLCVGVTITGQPPVIGQIYIVQRGDTLYGIARRFGVNMWSLAQLNNLLNLNRIYTGQRLIVPDVTIQ